MALGRSGRLFMRMTLGALLALCVYVALLPAASSAAEPGEPVGAFGPDGTVSTEFDAAVSVAVDQSTGAVYALDRGKQALYKFDAEGNPLDWGGVAVNISGHELSGLAVGFESQVAVDAETHVIYVASGNAVRAFEPNGEPHLFSAGPGEGTSEISGATNLVGIAVDKFGTIYASDVDFSQAKIRIYSRAGALITELAPKTDDKFNFQPTTLAVAPDGSLYVTKLQDPVLRLKPSQFPITASTTYSLGEFVNSKASVSVAVDPSTEFVYVGHLEPSERYRVTVFDEAGELVGSLGGPGQLGELQGRPTGIAVAGDEKRVYVSTRDEFSGEVSQVAMFQSFTFFEGAPTISGTSVTDLSSTSATLRAELNANTFETTYWFEYGVEDCASAPGSCTKVPLNGQSAGSGHTPVAVSETISGLSPSTKYFYRIVAENEFGEDEEGISRGPVRTFTTTVSIFGSQLIDSRVWEQVTPADKFSGAVTNGSLIQASEDGSGLAFQTRGPIVEDPESNRALEVSAVLAKRSDVGWGISDLVPTHTEAGGLGFGPEYKLFSTDLDRGVLEPRDDTPLSLESSERAPYLRFNTDPPTYRPLVTSKEGFANVPEGTVFGGEANLAQNPVAVSGANDSLTHIAISSQAALVAGAAARSIYMWSDGMLEPVSELPEGGGIVRGQLGSSELSVHNAVSSDGSRAFWAPGGAPTSSSNPAALYLRDIEADESVRLDLVSGGSGTGDAKPIFMGASDDGSVALFTDTQQLTADASPGGRDLYRCAIGDVGGSLGCTEIEDLSAPLEGSGESAEVEELLPGMSEDGSSAYFVAAAILDTEPNQAGEEAVSGGPNLYRWAEGQGVRFVALLSPQDDRNWGELGINPVGHGARISATSSPSGRYLAFMSERNLTGDESNDPKTGEPVEQAFLYDAGEDNLVCVSCNPRGATDNGHQLKASESEGGVIQPDPQGIWAGRWVSATLPEASEGEPTVGTTLYRPRAVLDNGRIFFNSVASLVSTDSNGTWDVYQYEPLGLGSCSPVAGSGTVVVTEGGCVGLISSGTNEMPSLFMDASASGDDIFFATFARLSVLDTDEIVDVYDARVNGRRAVAVEEPSACVGEACQPGGSPPQDLAPNSATFNGAGNVKAGKPPKHCSKGQRKVRKKGKVRCVPRKKGHHAKHGGTQK